MRGSTWGRPVVRNGSVNGSSSSIENPPEDERLRSRIELNER